MQTRTRHIERGDGSADDTRPPPHSVCYGALGVVLGPVLGLAIQGLMCAVSIRVMDVALAAGCTTFGELGRVLAGDVGGRTLEFIQMLNNALFLPVSLVIASGALQQVMLSALRCETGGTGLRDGRASSHACDLWDCNIFPLLCTCALAWPMLLFARNFGHLTGLAAVSIVLIVVQTAIILYYAATNAPDFAAPHIRVLAFGSSHLPWEKLISALSIYLYSFCPMFVAVEVAAGMKQPERIRVALVVSYAFPALCVYCPTGVAVALLWGANVPNPVTSAMGTGILSGVTNGMLLYSTLLDFVVAATPVNGVAQRRLFPELSDVKMTTRSIPRWLLITLPSLACALGLAIFVPQLDSLVGLLTFLCVPLAMLFGPAGMMLLSLRRRSASNPEAAGDSADLAKFDVAKLAADSKYLLALGVGVGLPFVPAIFAETIYSVSQLQLSGRYWCASVGD